MAATKIQDFGNKIGGAKKDEWKRRGLLFRDTLDMTDEEKAKYVKRDEIWPKPDWESLVAEGLDPAVGYYINEVRTGLEPKPHRLDPDGISKYIDAVKFFMDTAMQLRSQYDVEHYYRDTVRDEIIESGSMVVKLYDKYAYVVTNKTLKAMNATYFSCRNKAGQKLFGVPKGKKEYEAAKNSLRAYCFDGKTVYEMEDHHKRQMVAVKVFNGTFYYYPDEKINFDAGKYLVANIHSRKILLWNVEKDVADGFVEKLALAAQENADKGGSKPKSKRKQKFVLPESEEMKRFGGEFLGRDIEGNDYLGKFGFYGGEFGNWVSQKERQDSLNCGYYAFLDLASILGIDPVKVSLNGTLSIAFGARGSGTASAHYEPLRQVINLTKPRGAGCLAHEWGHALDYFLGKQRGLRAGGYCSESICDAPKAVAELVDSMRVQDGKRTEYIIGSEKFDKMFSKRDGYWGSRVEMFARAFDCYVSDKLKERGWRSDYLTDKADCFHVTVDGKTIYAIPMGKEREVINRNFDRMFDCLREMGVL